MHIHGEYWKKHNEKWQRIETDALFLYSVYFPHKKPAIVGK